MTDLRSFLFHITRDERLVDRAIKELCEIVDEYDGDWTPDMFLKFVSAVAKLLPQVEHLTAEFTGQKVEKSPWHPSPSGHPEEHERPADTAVGSWVGDSARSAVWADTKPKDDQPVKLEGKVSAWSPVCRAGGVPALREVKEKAVKEAPADPEDLCREFNHHPLAPPVDDYHAVSPEEEYEELNARQEAQVIARSEDQSDIKYHRNVE